MQLDDNVFNVVFGLIYFGGYSCKTSSFTLNDNSAFSGLFFDSTNLLFGRNDK